MVTALGSFPIGKPRWSSLECHDKQKQERDREKRDAVDCRREKQHKLQDRPRNTAYGFRIPDVFVDQPDDYRKSHYHEDETGPSRFVMQ